jgi:peptide/nickel transport system ATP-binding protein/oligopeptide transport system ATP-binding protein
MPILEVHDLQTHFFTDEGVVKAVDGVSYTLEPGEVLGIVGESGSGKSVSSLSTMGLIPDPPGRIVGGKILFTDKDGKKQDLVKLTDEEMRHVRGNRIAMIFQDPMTSLNPYMKVSAQLVEVLELHKGLSRSAAREKGIEMMRAVGIPDPVRRFDDYPHQLSGGMRQRVMIAMALLCDPEILIADEPTTALDVTIQAQILDLILERKEAMGVGVILITHDLGVVARLADRVCVMYAGRIVEEGTTEAIFADSRHPYTVGLARSIPRLDDPLTGPDGRSGRKLVPIRGMPPRLSHLPSGCPFRVRCDNAMPICAKEYPPVRVVGGAGGTEHRVCCHETDVDKIRAVATEVAS